MEKKTFSSFLMLFLLLFVLWFLVFRYMRDTEQEKRENTNQEAFTPGIRQFYRSNYRKARLAAEDFYSRSWTNISNVLRKRGIL
jgi:hypothetical protein